MSVNDLRELSIIELKNFILFGYGAGGFENLFKLKFANISNQFANHSHADIFEFFGEFGLDCHFDMDSLIHHLLPLKKKFQMQW